MPAVLIEARIGGIHVAVQVAIVHWWSRGPVGRTYVVPAIHAIVVYLDVLVLHVAMNGVVPADVVDVHVAMDDPAIHHHVLVSVVHIDVVDMDVRAAALHPTAAAVPTVIVNSVMMPIAIPVEPRTDEKPHAKGDSDSPSGPPVIANVGIINRNIDVLGLIRNDADVVVLDNYLLLRRGHQIPHVARHAAQSLDGHHYVGGLVDIRLAERGGPVDPVGHHGDDRGIVSNGLDADIPRLIINAVVAGGANPASRLVHIIHKCCGHQHLRKQRIWIKCDRGKKIIEFFGREWIVSELFILRGRFQIGRARNCLQQGKIGQTEREKNRESSTHERSFSFQLATMIFGPIDGFGSLTK